MGREESYNREESYSRSSFKSIHEDYNPRGMHPPYLAEEPEEYDEQHQEPHFSHDFSNDRRPYSRQEPTYRREEVEVQAYESDEPKYSQDSRFNPSHFPYLSVPRHGLILNVPEGKGRYSEDIYDKDYSDTSSQYNDVRPKDDGSRYHSRRIHSGH